MPKRSTHFIDESELLVQGKRKSNPSKKLLMAIASQPGGTQPAGKRGRGRPPKALAQKEV